MGLETKEIQGYWSKNVNVPLSLRILLAQNFDNWESSLRVSFFFFDIFLFFIFYFLFFIFYFLFFIFYFLFFIFYFLFFIFYFILTFVVIEKGKEN